VAAQGAARVAVAQTRLAPVCLWFDHTRAASESRRDEKQRYIRRFSANVWRKALRGGSAQPAVVPCTQSPRFVARAEGIELDVCAPGKTDRSAADRVKTDKRDAAGLISRRS